MHGDAPAVRVSTASTSALVNVAQPGAEGANEGSGGDPFESIAGWRGYQRIRKRDDGACGFLSRSNRCRLHEELGNRGQPLTCRMFPYQFHPASGEVVVTTSFGCPPVVANRGERIATGAPLDTITGLRTERLAQHPQGARPRTLIPGRIIEAKSIGILRDGLLAILNRTDDGMRDLRRNVGHMAAVLDDRPPARPGAPGWPRRGIGTQARTRRSERCGDTTDRISLPASQPRIARRQPTPGNG